jgi:DNA-binding winged helix-turn-helix (wHTH) protein/tetratricopeptide (TPR) repeat protein
MTSQDARQFEFGRFRLDPAGRELLRDGVRVPLTRKAFDTLLALVAEAGRVVPKQRLFERVWGDTVVGEATLTQNIYTLRKALKNDGERTPVIETLDGVGYRFVGDVTEVVSRAAPAQRRWSVASLAVLPFRSLGSGAAEAHLGLCLADALITRLSRLGRLVVRPSSAMFRWVDGAADPVTVGRELRVDAVLEGTLLGSEGRLRANVQLVDVRSGSPLWADKFDVPFVDVFAAEDEISEQVVTTLFERGSDLLAGRRPERAPSEEAHRAYVRGRFFWNKRTREGLDKAIDCFRGALELSPEYAEAWAGLADCFAVYPVYADVPQRETIPKAQEAATRALELHDAIPDPHASLAYTRFLYDWDWKAAAAGFARAIEIDPHYSTAHHWRAFLLSALGSHDEAVAAAVRAHELDPLSLVINADLALVLHFGGRHEEAIRQCHRTLDLEPSFAYAHFALGLACVSAGRAADGVNACRAAVDLSQRSSLTLAALGSALAAAGDPGSARRILAELESRFPGPYVPRVRLALVHAALGDREAALRALEQAVEDRSRFVAFLGVWPAFAPIRREPRYERLLEGIGLGALR